MSYCNNFSSFLSIPQDEFETLINNTAKQSSVILAGLNPEMMKRLYRFLFLNCSTSIHQLEIDWYHYRKTFIGIKSEQEQTDYLKQLSKHFGFRVELIISLLLYLQWRFVMRLDILEECLSLTDNLIRDEQVLQPIPTFLLELTNIQCAIDFQLPDWMDEFDDPAFFQSFSNR